LPGSKIQRPSGLQDQGAEPMPSGLQSPQAKPMPSGLLNPAAQQTSAGPHSSGSAPAPSGLGDPVGPELPHNPAAAVGHQTATAPLSRPQRPLLEAPQLGQINRPLADEATTDEPAPAGHGTPSGLPNRPAPHTAASQRGEAPQNPPAAPSGLPGLGHAQEDRTSGPPATQNPAQPAWSETHPTDGEESPSGLPPGPADN
jgi:hypothetical protein